MGLLVQRSELIDTENAFKIGPYIRASENQGKKVVKCDLEYIEQKSCKSGARSLIAGKARGIDLNLFKLDLFEREGDYGKRLCGSDTPSQSY